MVQSLLELVVNSMINQKFINGKLNDPPLKLVMNSMNNQMFILNEIFRKIRSNCVEWKNFQRIFRKYYALKMCPSYAIRYKLSFKMGIWPTLDFLS